MALKIDQQGPENKGPVSRLKNLVGLGSSSADSNNNSDFPIPRHNELHWLSVLSTPFITSAIAEQARTVAAASKISEEDSNDFVSLASKLLGLLYKPITATHPRSNSEIKIIPDGKNPDEKFDLVSSQAGHRGFWPTLKQILSPAVVRNITNLNFANYNLFSNMTIRANNDSDNRTFDFFYNIYKRPLMFWSSAIASGFSMLGSSMASLFAFLGNQDSHDASKYFANLSKAFEPLAVGLGAYNRGNLSLDRAKNDPEMTMKAALEERGISWLDFIQGRLGTYFGILNLPNLLINFFRDLSKKDSEGNLELPKHAKNLVTAVVLAAKSRGYLQNYDAYQLGEKTFNAVSRAHLDSSFTLKSISKQAANNKFFKPFLKTFMPVDHNGDIYFADETTINKYGDFRAAVDRQGLNNIVKDGREINMILGTIPKSEIFDELNGFVDPVQRMLMHLPAAFEDWKDGYIQDNGSSLMRTIDTIVGIAGVTLAAPSFFIYSLSSRIPQLIFNTYKFKQRLMHRKAETMKVRSLDELHRFENYNALDDLKNLVYKLENPNRFMSLGNLLPGAKFIAKVLRKSIIERPDMDDVFFDVSKMNQLTKELNAYAERQEETVKVPSFIRSIRAGIKNLMAKYSVFRVYRDEDGYTSREKSRMKTYQTLDGFQGVAERIPIIGSWIIGPALGILKSAFKVKKATKGIPAQAATTTNTLSSQGTNPLQNILGDFLKPRTA